MGICCKTQLCFLCSPDANRTSCDRMEESQKCEPNRQGITNCTHNTGQRQTLSDVTESRLQGASRKCSEVLSRHPEIGYRAWNKTDRRPNTEMYVTSFLKTERKNSGS